MTAVWQILLLAMILSSLMAESQSDNRIRIVTDLNRTTRTMQGGIGASWHAIEHPILGRAADGDPWSGSVWGGNPPFSDKAAWKSLYHYANWLGLDWCRVEIEQRMYEPAKGRFDWDNNEMKALYRILAWADKNNVDVFLQQQFSDVEWNAYPELRGNAKGILSSAPYNMDDFAEGLASLVDHLVRVKRYHSIKWLSITNEPGWDWTTWQGPDGKPVPLTPGLAAVRKALDAKHLSLPLSGPDWTDLPVFDESKIDFDEFIGAYDIHTYMSNFDGEPGGDYSLTEAEARIAKWAAWAHAHGKPMFLSELGSQMYGFRYSDAGPGSYQASLKDATLIIRAIHAGVDGINRWSFINRGDLDGQWQLVDTWDIPNNRLLQKFGPHPNAYFLIGLLTRFLAKNSEVLSTAASDGKGAPSAHGFSVALRSPRGQYTLMVANIAGNALDADFSFSGLTSGKNFYRYRMTSEQENKTDFTLGPQQKFKPSQQTPHFFDRLPARSVSIYSTYHLTQNQPGIIAETARHR